VTRTGGAKIRAWAAPNNSVGLVSTTKTVQSYGRRRCLKHPKRQRSGARLGALAAAGVVSVADSATRVGRPGRRRRHHRAAVAAKLTLRSQAVDREGQCQQKRPAVVDGARCGARGRPPPRVERHREGGRAPAQGERRGRLRRLEPNADAYFLAGTSGKNKKRHESTASPKAAAGGVVPPTSPSPPPHPPSRLPPMGATARRRQRRRPPPRRPLPHRPPVRLCRRPPRVGRGGERPGGRGGAAGGGRRHPPSHAGMTQRTCWRRRLRRGDGGGSGGSSVSTVASAPLQSSPWRQRGSARTPPLPSDDEHVGSTFPSVPKRAAAVLSGAVKGATGLDSLSSAALPGEMAGRRGDSHVSLRGCPQLRPGELCRPASGGGLTVAVAAAANTPPIDADAGEERTRSDGGADLPDAVAVKTPSTDEEEDTGQHSGRARRHRGRLRRRGIDGAAA